MKTTKLRTLVALAGILAAAAVQAGKPPHHAAPVVQLPQDAPTTTAKTPESGPTVAMPPPHENIAPGTLAPGYTREAQAATEQTRVSEK